MKVTAGRRACCLSFAVLVMLASRARAGEDPLSALETQHQALFERVAPAVVFLSAGSSFGSGFFVSKAGLILTNAHVVQGQQTVNVVLADGRRFSGRVVELAPNAVDLALVEIGAQDTPALQLDEHVPLRVGAFAAAVGHGRGGIWSFNTGMVSNIYPEGAERPIFQTQIPLNPGNSGGPVVDRKGRVMGIVTAAMRDSNSMNFAIRSEVALRQFHRLAARCACLIVTLPDEVPLFVDGKMVGKGPRVVVPAEPKVYEIFAVIRGAMKKFQVRYPEHRTLKID